ncbi:hypothetical protein [Psychromarinibacter halotolerans]|uniref:Ribbon-helix-helix CopG family protein n=1 Tax=Psychromarinibacter halotolerans TaxID=1775175 RepID=A0ABV7GS73_9RHOB|nr:hypothetical protein [Psychromarinibacter halotolerans]MDF0596913.1 hypothetical protein [Psychromarinibacter halotolerans]
MPNERELPVTVRLSAPVLAALTQYTRDHPEPGLSRPQAVRAALIELLREKGYLGD